MKGGNEGRGKRKEWKGMRTRRKTVKKDEIKNEGKGERTKNERGK